MTSCLAQPIDITYIISLQDANRESVGHLPKERIEQQIVKQRVTIGRINGEPFGYMLCHGRNDLIISQACIQYDARRRFYGAELVAFTTGLFRPDRIRLRCAADLEANLFWRSLGFVCVGNIKGGRRRGRLLNVWMKWNTLSLFDLAEIEQSPVMQKRIDCKYDSTDFFSDTPEGFTNGGELSKLTWKTDY